MFQAIVTKFHGPTDHHGARIRASADAGRIWHNYNPARSVDINHLEAAEALCLKLGWDGDWHGGALPGDTGYAHVRDNPEFKL